MAHKSSGSHRNKNRSGTKRLKFYNHKSADRQLEEELRNIVTDHAVVRYLQCIYGLDINMLRQEILGDKMQLVKTLTCGNLECGETILVCHQSKVVTVKRKK